MPVEHDTSDVALDADIDEYLGVAFAMATTGGFSKGTANVSPHDVQKLRGLMKYYAKKPHPFTACVKDNRKRFGPLTEKYCAVLKDLIEGNTKWRKGGKKSAGGKNLSDETLREIYALELPDGFGHWLSELDESVIDEIILAEEDDVVKEDLDFSDLLTRAGTLLAQGEEAAISDLEEIIQLCQQYASDEPDPEDKKVMEGVVTRLQKLLEKDKQEYSENDQILAEMNFAGSETKEGQDGLVWKTVLREGSWKFSPGQGQKPVARPITVVKTGKSDPRSLTISMAELKRNFEAGAVEHVTIPTSHADKVLENTGYVKKLRWGKDSEGRATLEAGLSFTEPEVKEKALRGTIANTSGGILFDYAHKESGQKFNAVLAHVALTNHPWLNGMQPFGVEASENLKVVAFSETPETESGQEPEGGKTMPEVEDTRATLLSELGFESEDALRAAVEENKRLREEARKNDIDAKVKKWTDDKKSPAMVTAAKTLLSASDDSTVLHLSEDGKDVGLTASDIVTRLMEAAPVVNLSTDPVKDEDVTGERKDTEVDDENDRANLSQEEKTLATQLFFEEGYSEKDAVAEAKKRLAAKS